MQTRTRGVARALGLGLLACALVGMFACKTRGDQFYREPHECDPTASEDPCGTTEDGKPMVCFAGSQLGGGSNFCVADCDPAQATTDPRYACVTPGALLQRCHPNKDASDKSADCPPKLQCYRTDLFADEGVCLMMRVCAEDSDCAGDSARSVCAATLVRSMSSLSTLKVDHLQCVKPRCQSGGSLCSDGESCLGNYYDYGSQVPDICVPNCDADLNCPPNFACSISPAGPGSPPICLPGLPGTRCVADQDCALGTCVDTGAGFSQCVLPLPCASNLDCAPFNGPGSTFVCAEGIPGRGHRCIKLAPFNGTNCVDDAGCPEGQRCYWFSPDGITPTHGECRVPCEGSQDCPARGGIPHVCLGEDAGCYPSRFAIPCTRDSDCLAEFTCSAVSPDERTQLQAPTICTMSCEKDADCQMHPLIRGNGGFCKEGEGLCRYTGQKGVPCDRDEQCVNSRCLLNASGVWQCG